MTVTVPTGFAAAAIEFRNEGDPDPWYITFGVDLSEAGGDYEGVCQTIVLAWTDTFLDGQSPTTMLSAVDLRIGNDGADPLIYRYNSGNLGTFSSPKLPQNCALLVSKNTGLGGRRNRGRFFVPNILEEQTVNEVGVITSGTVDAFQGFATTFLSELENPGGALPVPAPMVLLHNDAPGSDPTPTPVTSLRVSSTISTQRRRLR